MAEVSIQRLSFAYGGSNKEVLKDISWEVNRGEFVCILGQSGCGKSTLLRLLAGLEVPTVGEILLEGEPVKGAGLNRGVVFQDYGLFPWMTAGKNITLALHQRFPKADKSDLKKRALQALEDVGLTSEVFDKLPKELSGGMKQRCAIARALSVDPPVLLMDEPFGALDAITRARLQDLLIALWSKQEPKKTVFFVTHDVDEALLLATRIFVLGQSPTGTIYECSIAPEDKTSRDKQFDNDKIMHLRNDLIRHMNLNITERVS